MDQADTLSEPSLLLRELSSWTLVESVAVAIRILEGRIRDTDKPSEFLAIKIPRDEKVQVFVRFSIVWFTKSYRCPEPQLRIAAARDSNASPNTLQKIREARYSGQWSEAETPVGAVCTSRSDFDTMYVNDAPHIIELIQYPLQALCDLIWKFTLDTGKLRTLLDKNPNAQKPWLQTNSDSPLALAIEAGIRHAIGWPEGVMWAKDGVTSGVQGFRYWALQARPPINKKMLRATHEFNRDFARRLGGNEI